MSVNIGSTKITSASISVDTNAYSTGDLIGGKLTFTNALKKRPGFVTSVCIPDKAAQASDMDLVLFNEDPTATTFTDNAAFDIADSDLAKVMAVIGLGSSARFAFADNGVKFLGSLAIPVEAKASTGAYESTFYGALVSRGTPTFAASTDLTPVKLGVSQD